ncbi:hypothetical protein LXL04_004324 [Taraxacum kok-saghyz]
MARVAGGGLSSPEKQRKQPETLAWLDNREGEPRALRTEKRTETRELTSGEATAAGRWLPMAAGVQENEEEGAAGESLSRQQAVDEQRSPKVAGCRRKSGQGCWEQAPTVAQEVRRREKAAGLMLFSVATGKHDGGARLLGDAVRIKGCAGGVQVVGGFITEKTGRYTLSVEPFYRRTCRRIVDLPKHRNVVKLSQLGRILNKLLPSIEASSSNSAKKSGYVSLYFPPHHRCGMKTLSTSVISILWQSSVFSLLFCYGATDIAPSTTHNHRWIHQQHGKSWLCRTKRKALFVALDKIKEGYRSARKNYFGRKSYNYEIPGNLWACSEPDFLPVNPSKLNKLYISRKYKVLSKHGNWFQVKSSNLRFIVNLTVTVHESVKTGTAGTIVPIWPI